jgi:acyl dehydratase
MLTAGLICNLLGNRLPGTGMIYGLRELQLAAPVHADDRIRVTITAREKLPERRIVLFYCACVNSAGTPC